MEEKSLIQYLDKHPKPTGENAHALQLWYNSYGDCIEYQTEQVAIVADRIDNYLTIYRSAESNKAIGFQLKDIKALMKKCRSDVHLEWTTKKKTLVSVSALLLAALEEELPLSIKKRSGYLEAIRNLAKNDEVALVT